jgi:hypothetical protein
MGTSPIRSWHLSCDPYKYFVVQFAKLLVTVFPQVPGTMLGIINLIFQYLSPQTVVLLGFVSVVFVHVIPYLLDPYHIRKHPGPFFAKFTDAWLGMVCKDGHRSEVVHQMHLKYGAWKIMKLRMKLNPF